MSVLCKCFRNSTEELKSTTKEGFDLGAEKTRKSWRSRTPSSNGTSDRIDDSHCVLTMSGNGWSQNRRFTSLSENVGVWLVRREPDALEHDRVEEGVVARQVR